MDEYRLPAYHPPQSRSLQPVPGSSTASNMNPISPTISHSDDLKYIAKYKELKRKVAEAESENDRLQVKILKTRKNIQRLRLERSIMYETLADPRALDAIPLPSDATLFSPPQSQQPKPSSARYDHFSAPEGGLEFIQQDGQHHKHSRRTQAPPAPPPPTRHRPRHPEDSPHAGPSRPLKVAPDPEPAPMPSARVPGSAHGADGARTFPFVLEYAHSPATSAPTPAYPAEVRFYPYETSTHPVQRSRRDFEQAANAGRIAERERELKFRHHRPEPHAKAKTRSPEETHANYAYPLQHPFLSSEDMRRDEERDRTSYAPHQGQIEDTRRRDIANGVRKRKTSAGMVNERSREDCSLKQDAGRHCPPPRRGSYSRTGQEDDMREPRNAREERHKERDWQGEVPHRIHEGEAMD